MKPKNMFRVKALCCALLGALALGVAAEAMAERKPLFYRNPMNPAITSPTPAKDEMGMDYIPVYPEDGGAQESGYPTVTIRPEVINNLGVRTEPVARGELARRIDSVGYVEFDERNLFHVHLRAPGWVEDLRVRSLGERVETGQLLFRFYAPELVNAQREFIQSLAGGDANLARASEERLRALGIHDSTVRELRESRRPQQLIPVYARHGGIVSQLNLREGMYVEPQAETLTLADLSSVWVIVDVFERQASWVKPGQLAEIRLPALPGKVLKGRVEYLYPTLDPRTRTLRARLRFDNPGGELRPNMYASATVFAEPRPGVLNVPRGAVIRTELEARVVTSLGEGRFKPVAVETGLESGDRVEILAGLEEGQQVVVSAQFLLDSESNLKASLRRMMAPEPVAAPPPKLIPGIGKVNSVDPAAHKINITHEPIAEIGWPRMTMDFVALPGADIAGVTAGQKVRFELAEVAELDFRLASIAAADQPATAGRVYRGRAVVDRVELSARTVTITHEPMPELNWPVMTMDLGVAASVKLQGINKGDRVEFGLKALDASTYEVVELMPMQAAHGGHH